MSEMECACAKPQTLWTTVENPVDKPVENSAYAMSLSLITSSSLSDTQQATLDALDVLTARVDALDHDISTILGILNSPLDPIECLERLRNLREQYP